MKKILFIVTFVFALFFANAQEKSNTDNNKIVLWCSLELEDGTVLIPESRLYTDIYLSEKGKIKYIVVKKNGKYGICDLDGKEVIAPIYKYVMVSKVYDSRSFNELNYYFIDIEVENQHDMIADLNGNIQGTRKSGVVEKDSKGFFYRYIDFDLNSHKKYINLNQNSRYNFTPKNRKYIKTTSTLKEPLSF